MFHRSIQSKRESVSELLRMNSYFPFEIVQAIPNHVVALKNVIGNAEFDFLLKDISEATRRNISLNPMWQSRIGTGQSTVDTLTSQAIDTLVELVSTARNTLYEKYFPYDLTRTTIDQVLCYRKLPGMQMAEYAAQLIDPAYTRPDYAQLIDHAPIRPVYSQLTDPAHIRPDYFTGSTTQGSMSDDDILRLLGGCTQPIPKLLTGGY